MPRWGKILMTIAICILVLLLIMGFAGNILYINMMHSMVSNIEKSNETDEYIRKIKITDGDTNLVGYVRSSDFSKKKKVIIYLPGSGDIAYNAVLEHGKQFEDYVFACVDFHGAQESEGKMNKDSILNTGIRLYDYLIQQDYVDSDNIYIMGYSYSTGIVTYLASQRTCDKLVLVAPYCDSADMYNKYSPIYYGPMRMFITENFETAKYAKKVKSATLLITSKGDKTMNKKFAFSLQNDFPNAEVKEYNDIAHDSYFKSEAVTADIISFLAE